MSDFETPQLDSPFDLSQSRPLVTSGSPVGPAPTPVTPVASSTPAAPAIDDEFVAFAARENASAEREGLPPAYKMRADRHYVDQIASRSAGVPVRLIPVRDFDAADRETQADPVKAGNIEALTKSIAAHGVVEPLLVRKHQGKYRVIAGRKRLAAAHSAGVNEVPCLLHHVNDAEAAALARAENVRAGSTLEPSSPLIGGLRIIDVLQEVEANLASVAGSVALVGGRPSGAPFQERTALNMLRAQSWRAGWVASTAAFLLGGSRADRPRSAASIVDRIVDGFEPEHRLTGLDLRVGPLAVATLEAPAGELALTGAVLALLALTPDVDKPTVELRVSTMGAGGAIIEVDQRGVDLREQSRLFTEPDSPRRGQLQLALAISLLNAIASREGGSPELMSDRSASTIRCPVPVVHRV